MGEDEVGGQVASRSRRIVQGGGRRPARSGSSVGSGEALGARHRVTTTTPPTAACVPQMIHGGQ